MNEKDILNKLIKIAINQQKILQRIAQMDPNIQILTDIGNKAIIDFSSKLRRGDLTVKSQGDSYIINSGVITQFWDFARQRIELQIRQDKPELLIKVTFAPPTDV